MAASITFKRGGTFSYSCNLTLPAGTWTAACKLRNGRGELVETVTVTLSVNNAPPITHSLLLEVTGANTADWPLEALYGDVVFTDASATPVVIPSGTFTVNVIEKVTR